MGKQLFATASQWAITLLVAGLGFAFAVANSAYGTTLTTCPDCDGDKFAITYSFESDNGTTSIYDVTLFADTSGNNLGGGHIDAVALGFGSNMITVLAAMDAAPIAPGGWTGQGGGLNAGGCNGSGAFICASANSSLYFALAPNASTATTPYEWTWDVLIPDSFPGGAAAAFASGADVKIHYSDIQGHLVSDNFSFTRVPPPPRLTLPEPTTLFLFAGGLMGLAALRRKT
jgi:hypothetical protein